MADISYPQVVHDIKEKYIEATGVADNIKFGEIAQDVYDAITSGGGGIEITDITLNNDGTYTLTDTDSNTHTLTVLETNGQITSITYDGTSVTLTFDGSGNLIGVGDTDIDVSKYISGENGSFFNPVTLKMNLKLGAKIV